MKTPEHLKYTKEHEWVRITDEKTDDGKTIAYIGITDFAQSELGELVYVEVETVGELIEQDDVFGTVEAVKTTSDLFMPITGKILEFNPSLDESKGDDPALINSDPYTGGWVIKIAIEDDAGIETLMTADAYADLIG
jgi:glycine cleavage system H protein